MDSTLYNGQCRDCGAPLIDCKCHKESKMDTRTLEQVIMDASGKFCDSRELPPVATVEAAAIAEAVREWMRERECIMPGSLCKKTQDNARIKELEKQLEEERWMHAACLTIVEGSAGIESVEEILMPVSEAMRQCFRVRNELNAAKNRIKELQAEVERLKAMTYLPSNEAIDKAAKYDALRERFPFWPGEEFYAVDGNVISKHAVRAVYFDHVITQKNGSTYGHNQCHPTADACRAAIPVEE